MSGGGGVRLSWGHVNLNVRALERSIAFYALLGFEPLLSSIPYLGWSDEPDPRPIDPAGAEALGLPPGTRARGCILRLGEGFPMLDLTELAEPASTGPRSNADEGFVRLCLASRDLAGDHARLEAQGVRFLSPPRSTPQGAAPEGLAEIAVCADPDGNLIELIEVHLERWPRPQPGPG